MEQLTLRETKLELKKKGKGPPNRMNDLPYSEWMKFQKSFFRYKSIQALIEECICFFTKARWEENQPSRSLVIAKNFNASVISPPRVLDTYNETKLQKDIIEFLHKAEKSNSKYDFIMVDLRHHIKDTKHLSKFLYSYSSHVFRIIRKLLLPQRYCCIVVGMEEEGGEGFPLPWAVALSCRNHLRLRDEKIGLVEDKNKVIYCLFMQANDGERAGSFLPLESIRLAKSPNALPGWIIPKPRPRKEHEILHPAKFPETLVAEFIKLFTEPGDWVFDPMVGTGSTVIAALQTERNSLGVDLISEFVEIAQERVAIMDTPLFPSKQFDAKIIQGNATKLDKITEVPEEKFNYAITSPPYWSMLTNPGGENQKARRKKNLPLVYSEDERDLGNVENYDEFLEHIVSIYNRVAAKLVDDGVLTVIVKNVKRNHIIYPLAWDLVTKLCSDNNRYEYLGNTFWCQDDVGLKPFAVGIHWVSNTLHHYCLHFKKHR